MYLPHFSFVGQMELSGRPVNLDVQYLKVEQSLTLLAFAELSSSARVHLVPYGPAGVVVGVVGSVVGVVVGASIRGLGSGHLNSTLRSVL